MYSLRLACCSDQIDLLVAELWEASTIGIRELEEGGKRTLLAFFETNDRRRELLQRFADYTPEWTAEESTDWSAESRTRWHARSIGKRLLVAPVWSQDPTPDGRIRLVHNPGLACGTGEHPCTQMALMALEDCVTPGSTIVDIGTGSGILAIAAVQMGVRVAIGVDTDIAALQIARENFRLNSLAAPLVAGSADCIASRYADVTVANISGTVLLSIIEDLRRITREDGFLILTGFPEWEMSAFQAEFPEATVADVDEWRCITAKLSSRA